MAALYAQGLSWERMHQVVREYAGAMGSVRHLVSDLTLPLISIFSGAGFDRVVRESMALGAQRIEDLWLKCVLPLAPPQLITLLGFTRSVWRTCVPLEATPHSTEVARRDKEDFTMDTWSLCLLCSSSSIGCAS